jgi:hypothetical protein
MHRSHWTASGKMNEKLAGDDATAVRRLCYGVFNRRLNLLVVAGSVGGKIASTVTLSQMRQAGRLRSQLKLLRT